MIAEIKPNWKRAGITILVIICLYAAIISAQYMFATGKALADEMLYRHIDREWPRSGSLVYVPFGLDSCLHLAKFDPKVGFFYDDHGWLNADKFLYVTDRWPTEVKACTTEDGE